MSKLQDEQHMSEIILESEKSSIKNQKLLNKKKRGKKKQITIKKLVKMKILLKVQNLLNFQIPKKIRKKI